MVEFKNGKSRQTDRIDKTNIEESKSMKEEIVEQDHQQKVGTSSLIMK